MNIAQEENPLVSVIVITYNSSKYVIETLESIRKQLYQNLELIISDDNSTDKTIELCENWLNSNKSRFINTELITSSVNTGISANYNRGYKRANGTWIKAIAGDDLLLNTCITDNIDYVKWNKSAQIVFSKIRLFKNNNGIINIIDNNCENESFYKLNRQNQINKMLYENQIACTPSAFIRLNSLKAVDYNDENYPFLEDYPLWFKFLQNNFSFSYFPTNTVMYRIENSITRNQLTYINPKYLHSLELFYKEKLFPLYPIKMVLLKFDKYIYFLKMNIAVRYFKNSPTLFSRFTLFILNFVNPYYYFQKFKKKK